MKTSEQENYFDELKDSAVCSSCGGFKVLPENVWFDEQGYSYSTRLTKCPHCGKIVVLGYIEDYCLSRLNTDRRLYYKNK